MKETELSVAERDFLKSQHLTPGDVYDGWHESSASWKANVRKAGLTLVLGAPCSSAGHRLRTRSGHCVECDTSKLSYQRRHHSEGYVYIAGSKSARLIKIGTAINIPQREQNLRRQHYAEFEDWLVLFYAKVSTGGKIEGEALRRLSSYRVVRQYEKDGAMQAAEEVLRVTFSEALKVLTEVGQRELIDPWYHRSRTDYDFTD